MNHLDVELAKALDLGVWPFLAATGLLLPAAWTLPNSVL